MVQAPCSSSTPDSARSRRAFAGIEGEGELPLPVEVLAAPGHGDVLLHGPGNPLDDVGGVGGDAARHHPLVDVLDGGQAQVLAGGDVAEEIGAGGGGDGPADGAGDVVVARERCR